MNITNSIYGIHHYGQKNAGLVLHNFLLAFDDTFNKKNNARFKDF